MLKTIITVPFDYRDGYFISSNIQVDYIEYNYRAALFYYSNSLLSEQVDYTK